MPRLASIPTLTVLFSLSGCNRAPDPRTMTTAELLQSIAREPMYKNLERATGLWGELRSRPGSEVAALAMHALGSEDSDLQVTAASVLARLLTTEAKALGTEIASRCGAALLRQLDAPSQHARAGAASALSSVWFNGSSNLPPPELMKALPSLLASEEVRVRGLAVISAMSLSAPELDPVLAARLGAEPDAGLRLMLAVILSRRCEHSETAPALARALERALEDASADVRRAAADGLARPSTLDEPTLDRLRKLVESAVDRELATCCAYTLAVHTRGALSAESLLATVFGMEATLGEHERSKWLCSIGLLAAQAPGSAMATKAREVLTAELSSKDDSMAEEATAALARIARASGDAKLGQRMVQRLLDALAPYEDHEPTDYSCDRTIVFEALLNLVDWPDAKIDPAPLRARLTHVSTNCDRWTREWAKRRLAALR